MFERLQAHWVYGGFLAGLMLLALTPLFANRWTLGETLVFLSLPIYMLHQYEEHDDDRFRRFVNTHMAGGRDALTVSAVFWINIVGVWAVLTAVLWLTHRVSPGWGAIAAYLVLINGVIHVVQGFALRCYNPGLATSVVLFLPFGIWTLAAIWSQTTVVQHVIALAVVIALHACIFGVVMSRARAMQPA
jgi:hypothetical protein